MPIGEIKEKVTRGQARSWRRIPSNDALFAHATGRIRVLETKLLKQEELTLFSDRMTNPGVLNDILDRADFPLGQTLDERFSLEEKKTDRELKEMAGRSQLPKILLLEKDYHNAKWMLKQLLLAAQSDSGAPLPERADQDGGETEEQAFGLNRDQQTDPVLEREALTALEEDSSSEAASLTGLNTKSFNTEQILEAADAQAGRAEEGLFSEELRAKLLDGMIPHELLWQDILRLLRGAYLANACDPYLMAGVMRTVKAYLVWRDLSLVDIILDKSYYEELMILAAESKSKSEREFVSDFVSLKADAANFQMLLRAAAAKAGRAYLRQLLLPGGSVKRDDFVALYSTASAVLNREEGAPVPESAAAELQALLKGSLAESLAHHVLAYRSVPEIRALGRDTDNLLMDLARKGLRSSYSAESVAGYWLAKQTEVKNLRIMYACRDVDLSYEETLPLLRKLYRDYD